MDETFIGGKPRLGQIKSKADARMWAEQKTKVLGAVERGGRIHATIIPTRHSATILPLVRKYVLPATTVYSDEWVAYNPLTREGYSHSRVNHSQGVYVSGDVHTNTIEGFWALLKGGLIGVYHGVSDEYLQAYIDEFVWRYNHRDDERPMFWTFLDRVVKVAPTAS